MTQQKEVKVTDELRSFIGKKMDERVSPPVEASDIRKWAIAIYWPDTPPKHFWDEAYAKKTRFKGIIAPEDFNPFAWSIDKGQTFMTEQDLKEPSQRAGLGWNVLNGGGGNEYYLPIQPGDVIKSETVLGDVYIRQGKQWPMIFFIRKSTWKNQKNEVVRVSTGISIRY